MSVLIGQTVSDKPKVNGGAPPVGEVLLTCVLVIVAILWSLDGSPEETYEQVQAVAGAPAAAVMPSHPVTTSALAAPPKAAPRFHPDRPAPVTQETKSADGSAVTETKRKNPIARVAAVFRHLNPRGRKKTSVVKTTTPE